jgi:iron complex outermembrane receptor protein
MKPMTLHRTVIASALLLALDPATAQTARSDDPPTTGFADTAVASAAMTQLLGQDELRFSATTELTALMASLDAAANAPQTFLSGGSDIIRPATLAGMGPDQLLVLVNGKRRHQSALVNVNQTVGRGSAGTDLNAIALSAIDHIEVLHGDAAARYGGDATAGMINIVLKKTVDGGQLGGLVGSTAKGDGHVLSASASRGFALGSSGGYLDLTLEARRRGTTNRAGFDLLANPPRVTQRIGDIGTRDAYLWLNGALPAGAGELYAFGGLSRRRGDGYALFRGADDPRNVPAVYPRGYVPSLSMTVRDAALTLGYRRALGSDWKFDLSVNHGRNEIALRERDSINVRYWYEPTCACGIYAQSPTQADAGKLVLTQSMANLDFSGPLTLWGSSLTLSTGLEYRRDGYRIVAGEPVSYGFGRGDNPALWIPGPTNDLAPPGMQGFPGFSPANAIDASRRDVVYYLDIQQRLGKHLVLGSSARNERYSDIGAAASSNLILRYDPSPALGLNVGVAAGFRAPSVQQRFYSSNVTDLNSKGVMTRTLTEREGSAVVQALGIAPLVQESTRTVNAGIVLHGARAFSLSANAYRTRVYNRIVLSSPIAAETGDCSTPASCPVKTVLDPLRADQAQFFANAADTVTTGLDVLAEQAFHGDGATLTLSAQLGLNRTELTRRFSSSPFITAARLFDDAQVTLLEHGQPRRHHILKAELASAPWDLVARASYFGQVQGQGYTAPFVQTWGAKWLLDLSARYAVSRVLTFAAGVNNVFDTYPTAWDRRQAAPFPQMGFTYCWETCPYGLNGRSIYARMNYDF